MISLIYDCSGLNFSVGLYQNQQLMFSKKNTESHKHSEIMVATIDDMLKQHKLHYKDLDFVATTKGPGSFTGLRVGLAFLKTLQILANIKVMAVDNFTAYAYHYYQKIQQQKFANHSIFVALDSGNQHVYLCGFNIVQNGCNKNSWLKSFNYADFTSYLAENQQTIFVGNAKNLPESVRQEISINALQELCFLQYRGVNVGCNFDDKAEIFYNIENLY